MTSLLAARRIQVRYEAGTPPTLSEFSLLLRAGEFLGVVGPNGSGKSTLVRALSRALRPEHGAVSLGALDLYAGRTARESAQAIAVVPQDTAVSLDFSVRDVVRMGRAPHLPRRPFASETAADEGAVAGALAAARIEGLAERSVPTLSGGERQRVLLARALAQQADVLLLDEPTASLDLRHQAETLVLAQGLAHTQGKAVLAVLHDLNQASAYCDALALVSGGRLFAQGTPAEVLTAENLRAVYGTEVWVRPHPLSGRPLLLALPDLPQEARPDAPRVHVICGGGTGAGLLLALRRRGFGVTAAVLGDGDADADAAGALGVPFAREAPFSPLSAAALGEAARLAEDADAVVLTDVPFGPLNLANLDAALALRRAGKPVLCLQDPDAGFSARDHTGGAASRLWGLLLEAGATAVPDPGSVLGRLGGMKQGRP